MTLLTCPECESNEVTLVSEQSFMANTGEYYCENVKTSDSDARARCLHCWWEGRHDQLVGYGEDE